MTAVPTGTTLITSRVRGAEVRVGWNKNPPAEAVIEYEVTAKELSGTRQVTKTVIVNEAILSGMEPGITYGYSVRARNARGSSAASLPVYYTVPASKITLQKSTNLTTWEDASSAVHFPLKAAEFYRLKIEIIK